MDIRSYFRSQFRHDVAIFMPDQSLPYFGHSWNIDCGGLENILKENTASFLICLYFTVLIDQAMYTHYRRIYNEFESLTKYPKFCHGLGQFQKNPRLILDVPVDRKIVTLPQVTALLSEGMELFVDEVIDFSERYLPELNPSELFNKLIYDPDIQIPELVVMIDPKLKETAAWKAYENLRETVAHRFQNKAL